MENNDDFIYPDKEYQGWKSARESHEDDSRAAYEKWRIERDNTNKDSSDRLNKLFEESDNRIAKMSPRERRSLEEASNRHAKKARIESLGYYNHPNEKKEDIFKEEKKKR